MLLQKRGVLACSVSARSSVTSLLGIKLALNPRVFINSISLPFVTEVGATFRSRLVTS